ncbi:hypothetical protein FOA52_005175 [Chlamydomonas sp. UWO 241]|nr:hypothetical protein FOA52_005175 [Chlamydomonas sp. UWO 241]
MTEQQQQQHQIQVLTADALAQFAPPAGGAWDGVSRWVVFSDLHVNPKTLATCLQVLRQVHAEAEARGAGVLFLGDFWDERGSLPVEPLNAVLAELAAWTRPLLMLVGNHDQVDLGGHLHALTPLQLAFPARIHVFSAPALWGGALWMPYRRDHGTLRGAIAGAAAAARGGVDAVFCHADVQTARFNYLTQAKEGLPPGDFPPGTRVFTGHYHLPHDVPGSDITYVGSPYQVTASEAGENKRLLVLDASDGWRLCEEVPICVGPRHMRAEGPGALQRLAAHLADTDGAGVDGGVDGVGGEAGRKLRAGDRVKCVLPADADVAEWEVSRALLAAAGVRVELVQKAATRVPRMAAAEDMDVLTLLREYATTHGMSEDAHDAASAALSARVGAGGRGGGGAAARHVELCFGRMEVEGFGPFREFQEYDLGGRGLRVVTGENRDDSGADSNGSGKTSLVAAPLWALTGDMLARTESGATSGGARLAVDSMLNDDCKEARVRLEGTLNGQAFVVERAVKRGATKRLSYSLDGVAQDCQEVRTTQALIDEHFNTQLLRHAVFYGQNDMTAILEADDAAFKALLGKVVEMEVWEEARSSVREERTAHNREATSMDGALAQLRAQQGPGRAAEERARVQQAAWREQREAELAALSSDLSSTLAHARDIALSLESSERSLSVLAPRLSAWEGDAEAEAAAAQVPCPQTEDVPPPPVAPPPPRDDVGLLAQREAEDAAAAKLADEEAAVMSALAAEAEATTQGEALWLSHEEAALNARRREEARAATDAARGADEALAHGASKVAGLKARLELATQQLASAEASVQEGGGHDNGHGSHYGGAGSGNGSTGSSGSSAGSGSSDSGTASSGGGGGGASDAPQRVQVPDLAPVSGGGGGGGRGPGAGLVLVKPVCETCLQDIDAGQFLGRLMRMRSDAATIEAEFAKAVVELQSAEAASVAASKEQERVQTRYQQALQDALAAERARADAARAQRVAEEEVRVAAARARARGEAAARQAQVAAWEAQRASALAQWVAAWEAQRASALAQWHAQQARDKAEWDAARARVEATSRARQARGAAARERARALAAAARAARGALGQLEGARARWPNDGDGGGAGAGFGEAVREAVGAAGWAPEALDRLWGGVSAGAGAGAGGGGSGDNGAAEEEAKDAEQEHARRLVLAASSSQAAGAMVDGCSRLADAVNKAQLLAGRASSLSSGEDPYARQLETLIAQLANLEYAVSEKEGEQGAIRAKVAILDEADKALGRGGIPSFVLEGVLGELQHRTDGYLEQLADTMALELSATRPSAKAARGALASAAAAQSDSGEADDEAAAAGGAKGRKAKPRAVKTPKADEREKEEISKVVKVQVGTQWLPRSLAQLSGGERRRVALALALGFADLVRSRGRLSCNVLVLDEVLQQLDGEGYTRGAHAHTRTHTRDGEGYTRGAHAHTRTHTRTHTHTRAHTHTHTQDEVLQQLDGEGCTRVASLLRALPQESVLVVGQAHSFVTQESVLVVGQAHSFVTQAFEVVDTVVKTGGSSRIVSAG